MTQPSPLMGEGGERSERVRVTVADARPRQLRRNATDAEMRLWQAIRDRQLSGYKFRRQQRIGRYVVDFICHEARIVIEVDGGQHAVADEEERTRRIESDGYRVIRFWNNEVLTNLDGVLTAILQFMNRRRP